MFLFALAYFYLSFLRFIVDGTHLNDEHIRNYDMYKRGIAKPLSDSEYAINNDVEDDGIDDGIDDLVEEYFKQL